MSVPAWIQVLQALLTPAIAIAVGVIAFMQWRTAHQKVVLDLFDRRLRVYTDLEEAAVEFEISRGESAEAVSKCRQAYQHSKFLFGSDAFAEISKFYLTVTSFERIPAEVWIYDSEREKREAMTAKNSEAMEIVKSFRRQMPNTFEAYLRMDQKLVKTPLEWIAERNKLRLSYADEKQR